MKKWFTPLVVVCYMAVAPNWAGGQTVALPEQINTTFEENQPLVTLDGKRIYFSRRGDQRNMGDRNNADCWYAEKNSSGEWTDPIHCGMVINNFEDNALVATDFRSSWGLVKDGTDTGRFIELEINGPKIERTNQLTWTDSMSNFQVLDVHLLTERGIGILSIRDHGSGDTDLYVTVRTAKDTTWSMPIKLKGGINGRQDERYPHLAPDGETLYFSSTSHGGFGGSDIFISRLDGQDPSVWSSPKNMGRSINSALDETASSLSITDRTLYFVRTLPLKGSDLFSVNLEPTFLPQSMSLVAIHSDCQGQLVKTTFGDKTVRLPERDSVFNLVLDGNAASMITFLENQNKYYPSQMIWASPKEKLLDYEQQAYLDVVFADPDYKSSELEIQKLQRQILNTRTGLKEYSQLLATQIAGLAVPQTTVFENEGFKTDRTLLELEQKYEQFLRKSLSGKDAFQEELDEEHSLLVGREKRLAELKRQISKVDAIEETKVAKEQVPMSFLNFKEVVKREVELDIFPKVWEALVSDLKSEVQLEVKKNYDNEAYRNLLKGDWLKDSIPQFWKISQRNVVQPTYNNALAGDLKKHLEPMVRATMLGLLKEEVAAYLEKILHMVVLEKIQTAASKELRVLTNAQKDLEAKIFESLVESAKDNIELQEYIAPIDKQEFVEYEWSFESLPLVKHVYFELPALNFFGNEVQLNHFARLELNRIVQLLQTNLGVNLDILVHTHGYMTYSNADRLTNQRAEQIENYLSRAGIQPGRVKVIGVGKNYPKLANHNYENRKQNQRVEILIK